jgi:hypothetical protein
VINPIGEERNAVEGIELAGYSMLTMTLMHLAATALREATALLQSLATRDANGIVVLLWRFATGSVAKRRSAATSSK